jgi:hypothetical protein
LLLLLLLLYPSPLLPCSCIGDFNVSTKQATTCEHSWAAKVFAKLALTPALLLLLLLLLLPPPRPSLLHPPCSCIEYFKVSTNQGRYLEIGNRESTAPLKTNKPATGAFLGFFKGFTDVVNTNAATGMFSTVQVLGTGSNLITTSEPRAHEGGQRACLRTPVSQSGVSAIDHQASRQFQ